MGTPKLPQRRRKGTEMRGCMLFVTGLLVGVGLHTVAAQTPNRGLVGVNHIGMNVPNLEETVAYYTKTLGFPEAFRVNDDKGQARLVYVQVSKNTFIEIQPDPARPAAINHVGIHVENMAAATAMFKQRGANIGEIRASDTKAILNNITDPNGIRIELAELPPASMHRQAMDRWK
jgi:catechol 2,3-dioxygenase-like lactoylglutathione lyase family enzyme